MFRMKERKEAHQIKNVQYKMIHQLESIFHNLWPSDFNISLHMKFHVHNKLIHPYQCSASLIS